MKRLIALLLVTCLGGCAGTLSGTIVETGQTAKVSYDGAGLSGTLQVSLPNGEIFSGKYTEPDNLQELIAIQMKAKFTPNIKGTLSSNKERNMLCWLYATDRAFGLVTGGHDFCETADGQVIKIN